MGVCASSGGMFNNYADRPGRRPRRARRHVSPRLPAPPGDADRRDPQAARPGPVDQARRQPPGRDRAAGDRRPQGAADLARCGACCDDRHHDPTASQPGPLDRPGRRRPGDHARRRHPHAACSASSGSGDTSGYGGLVTPTVYPGGTQRPYGGWFDEVADALEARLEGHRPRRRDRAGRGPPRRDHLPRTPRGPALRRADAPRRRGAALRVLLGRQRRATTPTTPGASCTRSTTCSR